MLESSKHYEQFEVSAARSHAARLSLDAETEILAKLAAYPDVVLRAANAYEPHQVGNYLKELAAHSTVGTMNTKF